MAIKSSGYVKGMSLSGGTFTGITNWKLGGITDILQTPASTQETIPIKIQDSKGQLIGEILGHNDKNGNAEFRFALSNNLRNGNGFGNIILGVNSSGGVYASLGHDPVTSSNNRTIATSKWCRDVAALGTNGLIIKSSGADDGDSPFSMWWSRYYLFQNGLLINHGGLVLPETGTDFTFTFLKAFKDTAYSLLLSPRGSSTWWYGDKTETYFEFHSSNRHNFQFMAIGRGE